VGFWGRGERGLSPHLNAAIAVDRREEPLWLRQEGDFFGIEGILANQVLLGTSATLRTVGKFAPKNASLAIHAHKCVVGQRRKMVQALERSAIRGIADRGRICRRSTQEGRCRRLASCCQQAPRYARATLAIAPRGLHRTRSQRIGLLCFKKSFFSLISKLITVACSKGRVRLPFPRHGSSIVVGRIPAAAHRSAIQRQRLGGVCVSCRSLASPFFARPPFRVVRPGTSPPESWAKLAFRPHARGTPHQSEDNRRSVYRTSGSSCASRQLPEQPRFSPGGRRPAGSRWCSPCQEQGTYALSSACAGKYPMILGLSRSKMIR